MRWASSLLAQWVSSRCLRMLRHEPCKAAVVKHCYGCYRIKSIHAAYKHCILGDIMGTRVLIIDDDRDTAEFLKLLVEPRGDLARTASDAAQSKEILRAWRPEVVLMDLML